MHGERSVPLGYIKGHIYTKCSDKNSACKTLTRVQPLGLLFQPNDRCILPIQEDGRIRLSFILHTSTRTYGEKKKHKLHPNPSKRPWPPLKSLASA
uniref:Uncharacterized protein n=1 Tax=Anopheles minimus TaxID=112268 RepID=A0A182WPF4_9DIPT